MLDLSGNKIGNQILESYVFRHLQRLEELDLSNNNLHSFADKILGNLTKLKVLKLSENQLRTLEGNVIGQSLMSLHYLNISHCDLIQMDTRFLDKIPELKTLDLSHNSLTGLNKDHFKNLTKSTFIDLSFNQLSVLDDYAFDSLRLDYLNLANNDLTNVSRWAFNNLNCKELKLTNNSNLNIYQLRTALDGLTGLDNLDLSFLQIKDDHLSNGSFKQQAYDLKKLNLSNNHLTKLPKLPEFRMIQELDFSNNRITRLKQADIDVNIPAILDKMKTQQAYVHLHHNPYSCSKCFYDMVGLVKYISYNSRCSDDNEYYCLKCSKPSFLNGKDIRKLNITDDESCDQMPLTVLPYKSEFSYIFIIIIIVVTLSIFVLLVVLYQRRMLHTVYYSGRYYTREPRRQKIARLSLLKEDLKKANSSKQSSKKTEQQPDVANGKLNGTSKPHKVESEINSPFVDYKNPSEIDLIENNSLVNEVSVSKLGNNFEKGGSSSEIRSENNPLSENKKKLVQLSPESLYNVSEHSNCVNIYKDNRPQKVDSRIDDVQECSDPYLV